jgi:hypothetical protein
VELATATKSREQAMEEDHEQQIQKEPQENQHHRGESPQPEAQTAPQKSEHDHEQAATHGAEGIRSIENKKISTKTNRNKPRSDL